MRHLLLLFSILLLCAAANVQAQTKCNVNGKVADDAGEALGGASVMLLQAKDSILQSFAITAPDGRFKFEGVPAGDYVFKAIFAKHITYVRSIKIDDAQTEMAMEPVAMTPEASKLDDVQINEDRQPIRMKGDTIEYDAKAFKTQAGDNVENLLKKLPGVEVDNDGNIKAQGKNVVKVLVDGKEFFGDDPKVASKNLPAGAIDKVQVFDKKSEISDFTGIDDGTRDRTINLTLKQEYKKGYFGNAMAGYGTKDRYESKVSLNRFADKSQISFLGQANNTNQQGFSFQDYMNFVGGMANMGRNNTRDQTNGPSQLGINLSSNPNSGFFTTAASGVSANLDLSKKTKISTSYFYNYLQKDLDRTADKQTILENRSFLTDETGTQKDVNSNHRINLTLRSDLDSLTRISIRNTFSSNSTTSDVSNLTNSTISGGVGNFSDQLSTNAGGVLEINSNLYLMHKFRKRGRSTVLTGSFKTNPQDREVDLLSINGFTRNDSVPALRDTLHQNQLQTQGFLSYGGSLSYAEPIGKRSVIDATISYQETQNTLDKNFFDLDQEGLNPVQNPLLSNSYESVYRYGRGGINWRYFTQRLNLNTGLAVQQSQLDGTLLLTNTPIKKDFLNVLPSMEARYTITKNQRFDFRYNARVNEPTITQLQPVPDNSNPLSISVGNPDLGAEYAHVGRANYSLFDQFTFTSLFASVNATYTKNKISSLTTVDSLLRQVTRPVNVDHDINVNTNLNFSTPIRKLQMKFAVNGNSSIARSIVFINGEENFVNRFTQGGDIRFENKKKEHFDAAVGGRTSYTITKYPEASQLDQSYINSGVFGEVTLFLPKKFTVMSGLDCAVYSGAGFNSDQIVPLWRAYVSKKVFKNGRGEIKIAANDILNRNIGITRTAQLNYQQEERVSTLSRYFLGSFTYQIVAIGKKN
jgi:hypothetical protein